MLKHLRMAKNTTVEDDAPGKQRAISQNASAGDGGAELNIGPHQAFDDADCLEYELWRS